MAGLLDVPDSFQLCRNAGKRSFVHQELGRQLRAHLSSFVLWSVIPESRHRSQPICAPFLGYLGEQSGQATSARSIEKRVK